MDKLAVAKKLVEQTRFKDPRAKRIIEKIVQEANKRREKGGDKRVWPSK